MKKIYLIALLMVWSALNAQETSEGLNGQVLANGSPLAFASVKVKNRAIGTLTDTLGYFTLSGLTKGTYTLVFSYLGHKPVTQEITIGENSSDFLNVELTEHGESLEEVVVTGTLKEVRRSESPVPVEVYSPTFFKKNPTPNIYEALQNVNGVRPQLNCNVCNTGDIHINGLEGPYTMVLVDGMPIVSSLATVYGLSGIPNSLVERMEVVKGPASSLYGSEAIGGLINIITKNPAKAPIVSADLFASSWEEVNADFGLKFNLGNYASVLTGANYFLFDNPRDNNGDNFTDVTQQERISVFQKWQFHRKKNRVFSLAGRYYYEDRWGGALQWSPAYRGGDSIYGESIYTERWEVLGKYQLPTTEKLLLSFSYNNHDQNSVYGDIPYLAEQRIAFGQLTWDKQWRNHDMLLGTALRYTYYDDNTPATGGEAFGGANRPDEIWLPGLFVQDEIKITPKHNLLLGFRYDHNNLHGDIFTPRLAYKWSVSERDILRLNAGTGFRVVNLFTEDHAALTGAREVVIAETLNPERSYNVNLNYIKKIYLENGGFVGLDISAWYTYFNNVILPDYETNPNQILYDNLDGHAVTKGLSANVDITLPVGLTVLAGASLLDVSTEEGGIRERQILTERFTGTWSISYRFLNNNWLIDYTGNVYGPMRLPLLGPLDPRSPNSPTWSIQNIQLTYSGMKQVEVYGGVKNLLNWTPWRDEAFPIIARAFDPFDRGVEFDASGNVLATPENPYGLSFDPSYVYAPNQGMRGFLGIRYSIR